MIIQSNETSSGHGVSIYRLVIGVVVAVLFSFQALAQEEITSYHSDIDINIDGSMIVTETITVRSEGVNIRRGIFRDFPTDYRDRFGNHYVVSFDVLDVTRDGKVEPWNSERRSNGVRIYIGSEDAQLIPGEHSYQIRYRTNRQLGFFEDHDELYWNVTGNGWGFSILAASATVNLPGEVVGEALTLEAYTGVAGSAAQNFRSSINNNAAEFETTQILSPQEGLTIVVAWPKGIVSEPTDMQKLGYLLSDNRGLLIMLSALLLSTLYLYINWSRVGRDPEAGVIFPHYTPPKGYSPASARYIMQMGYDQKAFSAAVINLAVKGYLGIGNTGGSYSLMKQESNAKLAPGEKVLWSELFSKTNILKLSTDNLTTLTKAKSAHSKLLKKDYNRIYFNLNSLLLLPSTIASLAAFIFVAVSGVLTIFAGVVSIAILVIHLLFLYLMRAPSIKGRLLMDRLEGFKEYLRVAERDDLNLRNPPNLTPDLFEAYLPYALALGVEQAWADQFTKAFAAMEAKQGHAYRPAWYGGVFHSNNMAAFSSDIGTKFNSAISSATTAPSSTSGVGGGGFSGGGGGGGGGGGW